MSIEVILKPDGIYEQVTHVVQRKIGSLAECVQAELEASRATQCTVTKGLCRDSGLMVNMAAFPTHAVFARRFSKRPVGLRCFVRDGHIYKNEPAGETPRIPIDVIFDKNFWAKVPAETAVPEHWITYNTATQQVTCVLIYNKQAYHPLLPNVHNDGRICVGDSFMQMLSALKADNPDATPFDFFRTAFRSITSSPFNDDLRNYGLNRILTDAENKLIPFDVNNLSPISHADHVADLFK